MFSQDQPFTDSVTLNSPKTLYVDTVHSSMQFWCLIITYVFDMTQNGTARFSIQQKHNKSVWKQALVYSIWLIIWYAIIKHISDYIHNVKLLKWKWLKIYRRKTNANTMTEVTYVYKTCTIQLYILTDFSALTVFLGKSSGL